MIDRVHQQRQMILPIVILVLGVVLIWWMWIWPRTLQFKTYKRKTEIKARLYNIEPPPGVRVLSVQVLDLPASRSTKQLLALGMYSGDLDCDAVIAHYKEQFPRQDFTLTKEKEDPQKHDKTLSFSAPGYDASLSCTPQDLPQQNLPQLYFISMWTKA